MPRLADIAIAAVAAAVFAVAVESHADEPCGCANFAYQALKRVGIHLKTVPNVAGTSGRASYYRGVARIDPTSPCSVWVHEFAHHDQWLRGHEAARQFDVTWWALEDQAKAIERRAMENAGECEKQD